MSHTASFLQQLEARARAVQSLLCIGLDAHRTLLSAPTAQAAYDLCIRLIDQTHDLACAMKPNIAFFEVFGSEGIAALKDVIAYIHRVDPGLPVILDAKRGDIGSTAEAYAQAAFETLGASAITINPYMGHDSLAPFIRNAALGAFVLCRTSNQGSEDFQEQMMGGYWLYEWVALWAREQNALNNVGLVVGATSPAAILRIRRLVPEMWLLAPGVGEQGGQIRDVVADGLRADGMGLLISASRAIARADDPRAEARRLRDEINAEREEAPMASFLPSTEEARLAERLYEAECVRFGNFTLKSGQQSPFYIDLRRLVGYPDMLQAVSEGLTRLLYTLRFDHLAPIPYAALPIGIAAGIMGGYSVVYPRQEAKTYGTKAPVEGVFKPGDTAVIIDDVATNGESKLEAIRKLTDAGLVVRDVVVVIDREQGARQLIEAAGFRFHAMITISRLISEMAKLRLLSAAKQKEVLDYLAAQRSL